MQLKVTYYLDVVSSWCYWAEPTWTELKRRYADVATFEWRLALLDAAAMPASRAQEEWFFRRSGSIVRSPFMLSAAWVEPGRPEYLAANAVAEAGKEFGVTDDTLRLALAEAALRQGRQISSWDLCSQVGEESSGISASTLLDKARTPEVERRLRASTAEFHALRVTQRPTFVVEDEIGDRAVFSGLVQIEPFVATMDAMLRDCAAYASWKAHFGEPPAQ